MSSIEPRPRFAGHDGVNGTDGNAEIGGNGSHDLTGSSPFSDLPHISGSQLVSGTGCCKVTHVLSVVPEVKVPQVDTAKVPVVAGVQNVGVAGVTLVENPHGSGGRHVRAADAGCSAFGTERGLALIGDGERSLAENVSNGIPVKGFSGSGVAVGFYTLVMHSAVAILAMFAATAFDLTRFHTQKFNTRLGV